MTSLPSSPRPTALPPPDPGVATAATAFVDDAGTRAGAGTAEYEAEGVRIELKLLLDDVDMFVDSVHVAAMRHRAILDGLNAVETCMPGVRALAGRLLAARAVPTLGQVHAIRDRLDQVKNILRRTMDIQPSDEVARVLHTHVCQIGERVAAPPLMPASAGATASAGAERTLAAALEREFLREEAATRPRATSTTLPAQIPEEDGDEEE